MPIHSRVIELVMEWEEQRERGQAVTPEELCAKTPELLPEVKRRIEQMRRFQDLAETSSATDTKGDADGGDRPGRAAPLPSVFGRYRILSRLGEGGMGAVYLALDTKLDRQVALKVPHFSASDGQRVLDRFYREARSAATIQHPNICPVFDVGEQDGIPYLTMGLVEGKSLAQMVRHSKGLPAKKAAILVRKVALALQEAHRHGVIHRDLKPSNIMINLRSEPVVMDFGLARRASPGEAKLTHTGACMGTPAYMPPEQINGNHEAVGPASDIYSLGVVLYEVLSGQLPFRGEGIEVLSHILTKPPTPLRADIDPRLAAICMKAMSKEIKDRYASMRDLAAALEQFLKDVDPPPLAIPVAVPADASATQTSLPSPKKPRGGRWRWVAAAVAAMAVVIIAGIILYWPTPHGLVRIESDDPKVQIMFDKDGPTITGTDKTPIKLRAGEHGILVKRDGFTFETDKLIVKNGKTVTLNVALVKGKIQLAQDGKVIESHELPPPPDRKKTDGELALVFEDSLSNADSLQKFTCSFGQYGGRAEVVPGEGMRIGEGHCSGFVWAKPFLGDHYRVQFEVQIQEGGPGANWFLNGPGYGNNSDTAYWCRLHKTTVKLWRAGAPIQSVPLSKPIVPGEWATVQTEAVGGKIAVTINGQMFTLIDDAQPLTGPLHGWFGMSAGNEYRRAGTFVLCPGAWGKWAYFRNLRIWTSAKDSNRALQLTPPVTTKPVANGKLLYDFKPGPKELQSDWLKARWPTAVHIENGALALGDNVNAWPFVVLTKPLPSNVACEVEFEYPPFFAVNLWAMLWSGKKAPHSAKDCDGGWRVGLPAGDGKTVVVWDQALEGEYPPTPDPSAPTQPYYSPIGGRKYVARIETQGDEIRVFMDGGLLVKAKKPAGAASKGLPVFLCLYQFYSSSKVHAVRVFEIASETGRIAPAPPAAGPDRRAAEWVLSIGGSISIKENGKQRECRAVGDLPRGEFELTTVDLYANPKVSDGGLAHFKDCKNLTSLILAETKVSDAGLAHFKDCKNLTSLQLHSTKVGDAGLAHFKDCKNLTDLHLWRTRVSDAGLAHFENCKNLAHLVLGGTRVSDAGLAHFKDCKNLTYLQLNNTPVSNTGLLNFKDCKNLTELELRMTQVSDAGLGHFKNCKDLTKLDLHGTQVSDAGLERLAGFPLLTWVIVKNTKVTEAGVKKLSTALPKCKIEWDGGVIEP